MRGRDGENYVQLCPCQLEGVEEIPLRCWPLFVNIRNNYQWSQATVTDLSRKKASFKRVDGTDLMLRSRNEKSTALILACLQFINSPLGLASAWTADKLFRSPHILSLCLECCLAIHWDHALFVTTKLRLWHHVADSGDALNCHSHFWVPLVTSLLVAYGVCCWDLW